MLIRAYACAHVRAGVSICVSLSLLYLHLNLKGPYECAGDPNCAYYAGLSTQMYL